MGVPRGGVEYTSAAKALSAYTSAWRLWWAWHRLRTWIGYNAKEWPKQASDVAIVTSDPDTITHFSIASYDGAQHGACRMVICVNGALSSYRDVFNPPPSAYVREVWLVNVQSDGEVSGMEHNIVRVLVTPDYVRASLSEIQKKITEVYVYEGWNPDSLVQLVLGNKYDTTGIDA